MNKFISFKKWLNEQKSQDDTFGCVMLGTEIRNWKDVHLDGVEDIDVYIDPEDDSYGKEEEPHMTLVYGIHEDELDPEVIMSVIENNMDRVIVTISEISVFEGDKFDVVTYNIPATEQILKYRELFLDNFENTQAFPEYHPHMTIAYVKPGQGKKYATILDEPFEVVFKKGIYSFHEKNKEGEIENLTKQYVFPDLEDEV